MAAERRRGIPDNLDPLVDTLSNVVGILVVVVAVTQLQLGDALERVAALDARRGAAERAHDETASGLRAEVEAQRDRLANRLSGGIEASLTRAQATLAALRALPPSAADSSLEKDSNPRSNANSDSLEKVHALVERERKRLDAARATLTQRGEYAARLQEVPERQVARIPDPKEVLGRPSWILIRYGRVFLVDREKLFDEGERAIRRLLPHMAERPIRPDEFEAVSRYLRKQPVGFGSFRWQLQTEPNVRVKLSWRTPDAGIEGPRLASDPAFASWLRGLDPELDVIRFHVWADSFETYLEARKRVEQAGFQAGWTGLEVDEDLTLPIVVGGKRPDLRPLDVD